MASTEGSAVMVLPGGRSGPASRHRSPCQSPTTTTASCDAGTQPPSPEAIVSGDCGAALFNPCGLTASANGEVYVADTGHHRICVLKQGGMRVLAGSGARGFADGAGQDAAFAHPCGLAIDSEGTLYVADCGNHRIRRVTMDGVVTTIAGNGAAAHRDGQGRVASFYNPCGIAIDSNDVLYVADYSNNCVRVVSRGGVVATLSCHEDEAALDAPYGIAVHEDTSHLAEGSSGCGEASREGQRRAEKERDRTFARRGVRSQDRSPDPFLLRLPPPPQVSIFVSSYHSNSLAAISPDGQVSVLAGCGAAKHRDGSGKDAAFHAPNGLAIDSEGTLYVADSGNHCVRRVTLAGEVTTLAGTGQAAMSESQFNSPCGLCVSLLPGIGPALLITDRSNSCVRYLSVDALPPRRVAPSTLRQDLRRLLDGDSESVIEGEAVFEVEGRTLRASKAVMCVRSAHFRAMFTSGMRECSDDVVKVPGVAYAAFRSLVNYLFTDDLPRGMSAAHALELMMLANAYQLTRLEQLCEQALLLLLDRENASDIVAFAELIGACGLARASKRLIEGEQKDSSVADARAKSPRLSPPSSPLSPLDSSRMSCGETSPVEIC